MTKEPRDVIDIVRKHLEKLGAAGLVEEDGDCGCTLDDLMACGDGFSSCTAAKKVECLCDENCDFHLAPFDWKEPT